MATIFTETQKATNMSIVLELFRNTDPLVTFLGVFSSLAAPIKTTKIPVLWTQLHLSNSHTGALSSNVMVCGNGALGSS